MRGTNRVRTARAQLSLPESASAILEQIADLGILGKTKTEVATRIVTDWIWSNEDRLLRQGITLRQALIITEKKDS
jgi:hypothetical protein